MSRLSHLPASALLVLVACGGEDLASPDAGPADSGAVPLRPTLHVISPDDGAELSEARARIVFRVGTAPASGYAYRLGAAGAVESAQALTVGEEVTLELDLDVGVNRLEIDLLDTQGVAASEDLVLVVALDPAPIVQVDSPADGALFETETATVTGLVTTTTDVSTFEVTVNGAALTAVALDPTETGYTFEFVTPLGVGANTIVLEATDARGQTGRAQLTVSRELDTTAPAMRLIFPRNDHTVPTRRVFVRGHVEDSSTVEVEIEIDGQTADAAVAADGHFAAWVELSPGPNPYTIRATDVAGNRTTIESSVYFGQQLGAGGAHGGALIGGHLYTWGRNNAGQTGLGFESALGDASHPVSATEVATSTTFVSLFFNQNVSVALSDAGHVYGWGDNRYGQLCLGEATGFDEQDRTAPTRVLGVEGVVAISRGYSHALLLMNDGTVLACGRNNLGQLGDGTSEDRDRPVAVAGLRDIVQVSGGSQSSFALDASGHVWAWGRNRYGNLGNGVDDSDVHSTPAMVPGLDAVTMISTGRDHVIAVREDGTVRAWGLNASNQVGEDGVGGFADDVLSPVAVAFDAMAYATYANGNQGFVEDAEGRLWGWGQNGLGNLGIPLDEDQSRPTTPVFGVEAALDVAIGALHGFARTEQGSVYAWGWSFQGSLGGGDGAIDRWDYRIPVLVEFP